MLRSPQLHRLELLTSTDVAGHDTMDTYLHPDASIWHLVSAGHGSRCEYAFRCSGTMGLELT